jgi:hypothetical protein
MKSNLTFLVLAVSASLASASCSSSSSTSATPGADGGSDTAIDGCTIPSEDPAATCVRSVSGKVTDLDGKPIPNLTVSICGSVCFYAHTGADGSYVAAVNYNLVPTSFAALAHGRPDYASLYTKLPANAGATIALGPMRLPKYDGGVELPADGAAATSVTSGDVTLDIPANTAFDLDVEDYELPTGHQLRVGAAKITDLPEFAKTSGAVALYGLGPFGATATVMGTASGPGGAKAQKVGVRIKNTVNLAAGQKVEFFVLGVNLLSAPPTAGTVMVAAKGTVSADGQTIATDAGEGISTISWLGVRKVN